jgi:hypothetical protein
MAALPENKDSTDELLSDALMQCFRENGWGMSKPAQPERDPAKSPIACSFCFSEIPKSEAKKCGACKRRIYCKRECQEEDWTQRHGVGQGHKYWCKQNCGEEGVDWEVREISPIKGKGIVALRAFEKFDVILAEEFFDVSDRRNLDPRISKTIESLEPLTGTVAEKIELNSLGTAGGETGVSRRISRVNHACDPNAYHIFHKRRDPNIPDIKTLRAKKRIEKGEEIVISYVDYASDRYSYAHAQFMLQSKWRITCPPECRCRDKVYEKNMEKIRDLEHKISSLGNRGLGALAYQKARSLLVHLIEIGDSDERGCRTLYDGFQTGIMTEKYREGAISMIRKAETLSANVNGKDADETIRYANFTRNPSSHRNYAAIN